MLHRHAALHCQLHVFNHLPGVELHAQNALHALCRLPYLLGGEGPQCDGARKAHLQALGACKLHGLEADARLAAECHYQVVAVVGVNQFAAGFVFLNLAVGGLEAQVVGLHYVVVEFERCDDVLFASVFASVHGPRTLAANLVFGAARTLLGQHHLLHHLANHAVGQNHRHAAVFKRQVPCQTHEVAHLLHARWRQHYGVVVAVAAALACLEVVGLRGVNGAKAGTAAHHVDHQRGHLARGHVAHALLHQAEARARCGCEHGLAACGAGIHHVDCRHLALGLHHHHASGVPGLLLLQGLEHLALRGYGVTEVAVGAIADCRHGQRLVALHQCYFIIHCRVLFFLIYSV